MGVLSLVEPTKLTRRTGTESPRQDVSCIETPEQFSSLLRSEYSTISVRLLVKDSRSHYRYGSSASLAISQLNAGTKYRA